MERRIGTGAALVVGASATIQLSAALAHGLFDRLGPGGVSAWRFLLAAAVLLAVVRPAVRGRERAAWGAVVAYGLSLAALNISFFAAIDRMPMGIAVTLSFVGPLVMAVAASARRADVGWALLAAAGVATLGGLDRPDSASGVALALAAGCAWVAVAYTGRSLVRRTTGVDGLALATPVAALVALPLGATTVGEIDGRALVLLLVIAVGGLILPFALELEALRRLEPRLVAVVYSVDSGIAAVVGLLALGERLSAPADRGAGRRHGRERRRDCRASRQTVAA